MNEVEVHATGEICIACGSAVIDSYGNKRCRNMGCITRDRDNDLSWNSSEEEIRAVRQEQKEYLGPAS